MQIRPVPPTPVPQGPDITFFAVTGANGAAISPLGQIDGVPVFFRNSGSGFKLVVEGRTGSSGVVVGTTTFDSHLAIPHIVRICRSKQQPVGRWEPGRL